MGGKRVEEHEKCVYLIHPRFKMPFFRCNLRVIPGTDYCKRHTKKEAKNVSGETPQH
jgi:hypothetical protein